MLPAVAAATGSAAARDTAAALPQLTFTPRLTETPTLPNHTVRSCLPASWTAMRHRARQQFGS